MNNLKHHFPVDMADLKLRTCTHRIDLLLRESHYVEIRIQFHYIVTLALYFSTGHLYSVQICGS